MLSQRLFILLFLLPQKKKYNWVLSSKIFCFPRTMNVKLRHAEERNQGPQTGKSHRLPSFNSLLTLLTEQRGITWIIQVPRYPQNYILAKLSTTAITGEKIIQSTFHYLPFLLPVWTYWEWHWAVKQMAQEGKGIIHKLYKQLFLWARVDSVWNWSKVSNNIAEDWHLGSEAGDYKRLSRPKENFILKVTTEHVASNSRQFVWHFHGIRCI